MGDNDEDVIDTGADDGAKDDGAKNSDDSSQDDGANDGGDKKVQDDDKSKKADADDDAAPPVRKTASDYYNERHARKSAKVDTQKKNDDDGADDEDEIAPDDEEVISKVIDKRLAPVLEKIVGSEDKEEATKFFNENPEFKPYEAKIAKWWQDPSRRHLPIATVALEAVGYKNLIRIGAQKQKEADEKAAQTKTKGSSANNDGGSKPVSEMTNAEFLAKRDQVLRRQAE